MVYIVGNGYVTCRKTKNICHEIYISRLEAPRLIVSESNQERIRAQQARMADRARARRGQRKLLRVMKEKRNIKVAEIGKEVYMAVMKGCSGRSFKGEGINR